MGDLEAYEHIKHLEKELIRLVRRTAAGTVTKIDLIKAYRSATDAGLKDSKDYVESLQRESAPSELDLLKTRIASLEKWRSDVTS